jgi:hypothetical protein
MPGQVAEKMEAKKLNKTLLLICLALLVSLNQAYAKCTDRREFTRWQ